MSESQAKRSCSELGKLGRQAHVERVARNLNGWSLTVGGQRIFHVEEAEQLVASLTPKAARR